MLGVEVIQLHGVSNWSMGKIPYLKCIFSSSSEYACSYNLSESQVQLKNDLK